MARWESWLIRDTVTVENTGSSPVRVATCRNVSKISHYSKPEAWVSNPTGLAMSARARKLLGIKSADMRLGDLKLAIKNIIGRFGMNTDAVAGRNGGART